MKRFLYILSIVAAVLTVAVLALFTMAVSADTGYVSEKVVFISDSAVEGGDGSSADSPLYPTPVSKSELEPLEVVQTQSGTSPTETKRVTVYSYYKNTSLYQAVQMLSETGGTVVICGNVELTDDECRGSNHSAVLEYHLPKTEKPVTITSVYNGVDYRDEATLTLSGHFFTILNCETLWENMNIHSNLAGDRSICCNGNKTVFGEGLSCTTSGSGSAYYLSIAGGARYSSFNYDINVAVKSGRFYKLVGTTWTNPGKEIGCTGDVYLNIEGGHISYVYGNSHNTVPYAVHAGNVNINVSGGQIDGFIACTGNGGFKNETFEANVRITGGKFGSSFKVVSRSQYSSIVSGVESKRITVDLNDTGNVTNSALNKIISNVPQGATLIYPTHWITDNRKVISFPRETFVFSGDEPSAIGTTLKIEYKNPVTGAVYGEHIIECTENNTAFKAVCDTSKGGKKTADYYFGEWKYHSADIDVIPVPTVDILGVQIRTDTRAQQMCAWGEYSFNEESPVAIKECGIIAIPSDMLLNNEQFDHSNTFGMYDVLADKNLEVGMGRLFTALVLGDEVIRENNYNRGYSMRAYVKISYKGMDYYRYSDTIERCLYDVAVNASAGNETQETKSYLKNNLISVCDNYDPTYLYNPEGAEAARKQVVDYMYKMSNIEWTPNETFILYNEGTYNEYSVSSGSTRMYAVFYAGQKYQGIPYVNKKLTQYETFLDMIDRTSIIPLDNPNLVFDKNNGIKDFDNLTPEQKAAGLENAKNFPGNDCWGGMIYGWNCVLNGRDENKKLTSIDNMLTLKYGTVKVGEYEIDETYIVSGRNNTKAITAMIDDQVMAEAYAKLQPGDATVHSTQIFSEELEKYTSNARHVRIVTGVEVVRKSNNLIDLDASKVNFIHQAGGATSVYIYNSGDKSLGETSYTFRRLKDQGNLPMSIPELMTGNVDKPMAVASGVELEDELPNKLLSGVIKSNKHIMSVRVVFSQNGQLIGERKELVASTYGTVRLTEYSLSEVDLGEITLKSGEEYTFDLYVCIAGMDGQEIKVIPSYEFTAK